MITHNNHNIQTSMPPVVFEPTIPESERPQTHVSDRAGTGIGVCNNTCRELRTISYQASAVNVWAYS